MEVSVGFLHCKYGTCVLRKSSTLMIPDLCIRANSTFKSSFKSIGIIRCWLETAFLFFGMSFTSNSVFSSQYPFCVSRKCHHCQPGYLKLLASLFRLELCQFNQIVQKFWFKILRSLLGWAFRFHWVKSFFSGFVSVLRCDPRFCQDFRVSGKGMCCFAARVCSFWEVRVSRESDRDDLPEPFGGLP